MEKVKERQAAREAGKNNVKDNVEEVRITEEPVAIFISNGELKATTKINAKSYRKALSSIEEYGVEGCNVIIQDAMKQYGVIDDARLVVQPKKQANAE